MVSICRIPKNTLIELPSGWGYKIPVKGKTIELGGCRYPVIQIHERALSTSERFRRGMLGVAAVICTLCFGLFLSNIMSLFKSHESVYFIEEGSSIPSRNRSNIIKRIDKSYPRTSSTNNIGKQLPCSTRPQNSSSNIMEENIENWVGYTNPTE